MIVVKPCGGLSNYLRVVLSWYSYAKSINSKLIVIWEVNDTCNGFFLDYFEETNGITFVRDNSNNYHINYSGTSAKNGYIRNIKYHEILKPKKYINKIVKKKIRKINGNNINNITYEYERKIIIKGGKKGTNNKMQKNKKVQNKYYSIHIRRTDHIDLAKSRNKFTTDKEFHTFINKNKNKNFYIATDDPKTYNAFKNRHKKNIKFKYHETNDSEFRKTSMRDAIIDIYMCVYADKFIGSGYSSFSNLIKSLRKEKNL